MAATTNDAVPVTAEAREAAADLLNEVSSLLGDDGIGQVADLIRDGEYDEHDATLAFARFERDILARHRGSTAGVGEVCARFSRVAANIPDRVADDRTVCIEMPYKQDERVTGPQGETPLSLIISLDGLTIGDFRALASLSQTPATPMDELQRLGQEFDGGSLGRFGHHPEPAIDFEYEVEQIESIISDLEKGMRQGEPVPLDRIERAMTFRVGGDPSAVAAKETLRRLEQRARALSAPMVQEGFREALAKRCDGIEQPAFEAWAKAQGFDMTEHPLHYLFLDAKTDAARQAWCAGIKHASDRIAALSATPAQEGEQ